MRETAKDRKTKRKNSDS